MLRISNGYSMVYRRIVLLVLYGVPKLEIKII